MNKPKTCLNRTPRKNSNYFFVSYAHADSDKVYSILDLLYEKGANYWYDVNLSVGDVWDSTVGEVLMSDNCKGAVMFLSKNSIKSDAVYQDRKFCCY